VWATVETDNKIRVTSHRVVEICMSDIIRVYCFNG
jgi:hypothetical protein